MRHQRNPLSRQVQNLFCDDRRLPLIEGVSGEPAAEEPGAKRHEAGPKTKNAAERALAIDESDAGAHVSMAIVTHWYDWNWAAAEKEFKRAIELSPNNSDAHTYYSWFLAPMGRNDQAIAEAKRAQQADPLSGFAAFSVGAALVFARRWDPAIEQLRRAIEIDPNFWFGHCFLGRAYEQKGKLPEAIVEFQRAVELEKDNAETWSGLGHAYALSGNRAEAQKILDHLKEVSAHRWVAPHNIAVIHAGLGHKDHAFALLDQAYKDRSYYLPTSLATNARMDSLRSDSRFGKLNRRVGHLSDASCWLRPSVGVRVAGRSSATLTLGLLLGCSSSAYKNALPSSVQCLPSYPNWGQAS